MDPVQHWLNNNSPWIIWNTVCKVVGTTEKSTQYKNYIETKCVTKRIQKFTCTQMEKKMGTKSLITNSFFLLWVND